MAIRNRNLLAAVVIAGCGAATFGGVAIASAPLSNDDQQPRQPVGLSATVGGLSEAEISQTVAAMPIEVQEGNRALLKDLANNKVPVGGRDGMVGYVSADVLGTGLPRSEADLAPVVDEDGLVVAYYGSELGVIDKELVEAPGELDIAALDAERNPTTR